jgi:hypothetical protein
MHPRATFTDAETPGAVPSLQTSELSIPELVAEVYQSAPAVERGRLLEHLLRPLGVLSLFGVAGGIFAKARLRGGWEDMHIRLEDIQGVRPSDVVALVEHAQQVSVEAVDGLAQRLASSPVLSGSAAAVLLVTLLVQRARSRRRGVPERESAAAPAALPGLQPGAARGRPTGSRSGT